MQLLIIIRVARGRAFGYASTTQPVDHPTSIAFRSGLSSTIRDIERTDPLARSATSDMEREIAAETKLAASASNARF